MLNQCVEEDGALGCLSEHEMMGRGVENINLN